MTAQIAIADTASIVLLPLVIDPARATRAALGALAIAVCALVLFLVLRERCPPRVGASGCTTTRRSTGSHSNCGSACSCLFVLCALATTTHVSIMLAGFALGLVVAGIGTASPAGTSAVRHHRGLLRPAVLRLARLRRCRCANSASARASSCSAVGPGSWCPACALRRAGTGPAADPGGVVGSTTRCTRRRSDAGHRGAPARRRRAVGVDARRAADDRVNVDRGDARRSASESGFQRVSGVGGRRSVRVRADAVGPFERAAQRERRAVADLPRDRGDRRLAGPQQVGGQRQAPAGQERDRRLADELGEPAREHRTRRANGRSQIRDRPRMRGIVVDQPERRPDDRIVFGVPPRRRVLRRGRTRCAAPRSAARRAAGRGRPPGPSRRDRPLRPADRPAGCPTRRARSTNTVGSASSSRALTSLCPS